MRIPRVVAAALVVGLAAGCWLWWSGTKGQQRTGVPMDEKYNKSDEEWRSILTEEQFRVTRKQGTERAFTGAYWNNHEDGVYRCVCCGLPLFDSSAKYDSGTGWPSFWQPLETGNVSLHEDRSLFQTRTEVCCSRCAAHLGHVFEDGPPPTGLRYCMNSAALTFVPRAAPPPKDGGEK